MKSKTRGERLLALLTPSRTVPVLAWTAPTTWSLNPLRLTLVSFGLVIFGLGEALLIQSALGNSPWSVLAEGISKSTPLSIGWATALISAVILIFWWPLKQKLGFGTVANAILIASSLQIGLIIFPEVSGTLWLQITYVLIGIITVGIGTALYITCGLGPGPRDGLMTGIHRVTGVRVSRVRLGIEFTVLAVGFLLGGTVGIATAIWALFIGNSVAIFLNVILRVSNRYSSRSDIS
jgi:uncharacterized membrane protein YczE